MDWPGQQAGASSCLSQQWEEVSGKIWEEQESCRQQWGRRAEPGPGLLESTQEAKCGRR